MTVVSSESVNNHMRNPKWNVGVLNVPDRHPNVTLYSHSQATRDFNKMDMDIYQSRKKTSFYDDKKTPKSIWALLTLSAGAVLFMLYRCAKKK